MPHDVENMAKAAVMISLQTGGYRLSMLPSHTAGLIILWLCILYLGVAVDVSVIKTLSQSLAKVALMGLIFNIHICLA